MFAFEMGGAANLVTVTGTGALITLAGTLQVSVVPTFAAPVGTVLALIDNQAAAVINGTFAGLPEGPTFAAAGRMWRISYMGQLGGDPYPDVTLTLQATAYGVNGRAWSDTNGNGRQDAGEAGVAGVSVFLFDLNGNV